ncbi:MAG: hypothetical protein Q8P27_01370 [Candidatus Peregrinibacteria bacterium]|nr:hypothetical protein [Candidatus Peregrinibacteria bacterium]
MIIDVELEKLIAFVMMASLPIWILSFMIYADHKELKRHDQQRGKN